MTAGAVRGAERPIPVRVHVHVWVHVASGPASRLVCRCACGETLTPEQILELREAAGLPIPEPRVAKVVPKRSPSPRSRVEPGDPERWRRRASAKAAPRCTVTVPDEFGTLTRRGWYLGVDDAGRAVVGFAGVQDVARFPAEQVEVTL